jgi:endonuclease III
VACDIDLVIALLDKTYGPRPWRRHGDPLGELVATVLSQHTSDGTQPDCDPLIHPR